MSPLVVRACRLHQQAAGPLCFWYFITHRAYDVDNTERWAPYFLQPQPGVADFRPRLDVGFPKEFPRFWSY